MPDAMLAHLIRPTFIDRIKYSRRIRQFSPLSERVIYADTCIMEFIAVAFVVILPLKRVFQRNGKSVLEIITVK
ncbi:Uncharacterised protein [Shigella flexneri]|nr:Uncharacterised protein [Shigella flexneri]